MTAAARPAAAAPLAEPLLSGPILPTRLRFALPNMAGAVRWANWGPEH